MKADPREQRDLLKLQDADTRLQRLEHTLANLPQNAELAGLEAESAQVGARFLDAEGALEDARAELSRIESDVSVVDARLERDSARLQQTSSVKDVQALEAELDALRNRKSDLEDIELTVMEKVDELEKALAAVSAERAALTERAAELERERAAETERLGEEKEGVLSERSGVAAGIGPELIALYERQRDRYGTGAALLRGGVSLGSNVTLTGSDLERVRTASPDEVILDPESGCILVRTEES